MSLRCPTCPPGRCTRRGQLPGAGWACRHLAEAQALSDQIPPAPDPSPPARFAGWSRGVVIPCPARRPDGELCGNRPYSAGPAGLPERRCDGPGGCGHVWNPEASVRPPLASHLRQDPRPARPLAAALTSTDPEDTP